MTITTLELFTVVRNIVIAVTAIDEAKVILAEQNKPAPDGQYATIQVKRSVRQRGQANIHRSNVTPIASNLVEVDIRAQIIAECSIQFYRGFAYDEAEKLDQCNKRPDISAILLAAKVGWNRSDPSINLTALQSGNFEQRAGKMIYLMYETSSAVEINNILKVPYEVETLVDGDAETLATGIIE